MYDPDGYLPGDGIYAIGIILTCIVIPICMGYENAKYYYCYVNENSYELLPIKNTKIVSSLEEAEDEADYYEGEGFDVKWNLLKNKKQASI